MARLWMASCEIQTLKREYVVSRLRDRELTERERAYRSFNGSLERELNLLRVILVFKYEDYLYIFLSLEESFTNTSFLSSFSAQIMPNEKPYIMNRFGIFVFLRI